MRRTTLQSTRRVNLPLCDGEPHPRRKIWYARPPNRRTACCKLAQPDQPPVKSGGGSTVPPQILYVLPIRHAQPPPSEDRCLARDACHPAERGRTDGVADAAWRVWRCRASRASCPSPSSGRRGRAGCPCRAPPWRRFIVAVRRVPILRTVRALASLAWCGRRIERRAATPLLCSAACQRCVPSVLSADSGSTARSPHLVLIFASLLKPMQRCR